MKRFLIILAGIAALATAGHAASTRVTTGDNMVFNKVTVASTTVSTLYTYSSSRGALTCINGDASNAVYIGSHTAITAAGSSSFPLFAKQSIQILNTGALFAIADTGVSSVLVYCLQEF